MLRGVQGKVYDLESYLPERLVDEGFRWQTLARLLAGKLARKVTGGRVAPRWPQSVVAYYGQIAVFDKPDHHVGGLAFGRDFPRVLNELGIGRRGRVFEFCAGPGYIGYSLLAAGWCESLVLSDVNPDTVSAAASRLRTTSSTTASSSTAPTPSIGSPRGSAGTWSWATRRTSSPANRRRAHVRPQLGACTGASTPRSGAT